MEEIIKLLASDTDKALKQLTINSKEIEVIENLRKEYGEINRDIRETQIGKIQKDKIVGEAKKKKVVKGVRIPIPFQNKIVTTATAFEFGEPISLIPSEENKLTEEIDRLWKNNRVDSILQKLKILQKSELQCALLFYIKDIDPKTIFNKQMGENKTKEIKVKILENKNGKMSPVWDEYGDMIGFVWEFATKDINGKDIKNAWVYDNQKIHKCSTASGKMILDSSDDHGFGKIPIVYCSQEREEWFRVQTMIDRLEVTVSKLGAANDYSGQPILKLYGEILSAGDKDEDGKALRFPVKEDEDTGKTTHGDAEFLERTNAAESVKLEIEALEKYIYSLTSTPDISFDNVKGLGAISGIAIKLMFLDAMIKAKLNEGENRTIVERIINVFIAGNVNTTNTGYKTLAEKTFFGVQFNSILPDDLKESVETLARAVEGKIMSVKTAVKSLDMAEDVEEEISDITATSEKKEESTSKVL